MNISNGNDNITILDLPDEILQFIFNKLNVVDLLYSLGDVNQRFERLVFNARCVHHLDFVIESLNDSNFPISMDILDKICEKVLPRINEKIINLTLGSFSIERVLTVANYPQLHSLSLVNFQPKILLRYLTDGILLHLLTAQTTHLVVDLIDEKRETSDQTQLDLLEFILLNGAHLKDLTFIDKASYEYPTISPYNIPRVRNLMSSTITKLTMNVNNFNDCRDILNGSFQSLSTLIIHLDERSASPRRDNLLNIKPFQLKSFSLITHYYTFDYDRLIVPSLQRMVNLEELTLFLCVTRSKSAYIDGDHLYNEILSYMPQLHKFIFNIHTQVEPGYRRKILLQSNDQIRNSFLRRGIQSIDVCSDEQFLYNRAHCHVYTLPYQFKKFLFLNNSFHGGQFDNVRTLKMNDLRPFEQKFFHMIAQDFPFLQSLTLSNYIAPKNQLNHSSTSIRFNHLLKLDLIDAHFDYAKQFLSHENIRLPRLTNLIIEYHTLKTVTKNFTNQETCLTCAKIKSLTTYQALPNTDDFHSYFPSL